MGSEEIAGFEDMFSSHEWDAIQTDDWSFVDIEANHQFGDLTFEDSAPDGATAETHYVTIYDPPGQHAGNERRFELECDRCGDIGATDTAQEAEALALLHRKFMATVEPSALHLSEIIETGSGYDVKCPTCGVIGNADDEELAKTLGRLHEHAFELAGASEEMAVG